MSRRRRLRSILFILSCLGGIGVCLAGDIYRTVDAQGNVTYSDHAISAASRVVTIDVAAANPENAARLAKQQAVISASEAERAKAARKESADQQEHQAEVAAQAHQCEAARSRYAAFAVGGRIWHPDAQGNRMFYSDQEIQAERVRSKSAMDSACAQQVP
jgi:hypothetical protein